MDTIGPTALHDPAPAEALPRDQSEATSSEVRLMSRPAAGTHLRACQFRTRAY